MSVEYDPSVVWTERTFAERTYDVTPIHVCGYWECCMSRIISRRLGLPTILGITSGNAASISVSDLRVLKLTVMVYFLVDPVGADVLAGSC